MRIDTGSISVITNPKALQALVLDHLKMTATLVPLPAAPQIPGMPQLAPAVPSFKPPAMPPVSAQSLGKSLIDGHPVDGVRYTIQPPTPPQVPQAPKMPQAPQVPGMPQAPQIPGMPQAPKPPQIPTVADVWTSTKLGLPVLTKVTGAFGQQTCYCNAAQSAEPSPALFQIPPGYTPVLPKPPAPPAPPALPALPGK